MEIRGESYILSESFSVKQDDCGALTAHLATVSVHDGEFEI